MSRSAGSLTSSTGLAMPRTPSSSTSGATTGPPGRARTGPSWWATGKRTRSCASWHRLGWLRTAFRLSINTDLVVAYQASPLLPRTVGINDVLVTMGGNVFLIEPANHAVSLSLRRELACSVCVFVTVHTMGNHWRTCDAGQTEPSLCAWVCRVDQKLMPERRNMPPVKLTLKAKPVALAVEQFVVRRVFVPVRTVGRLRPRDFSADTAPLPSGARVLRVRFEIVPERLQMVAISVALTTDPVSICIAQSVVLVVCVPLRACQYDLRSTFQILLE